MKKAVKAVKAVKAIEPDKKKEKEKGNGLPDGFLGSVEGKKLCIALPEPGQVKHVTTSDVRWLATLSRVVSVLSEPFRGEDGKLHKAVSEDELIDISTLFLDCPVSFFTNAGKKAFKAIEADDTDKAIITKLSTGFFFPSETIIPGRVWRFAHATGKLVATMTLSKGKFSVALEKVENNPEE